jgi:hypothetical protein
VALADGMRRVASAVRPEEHQPACPAPMGKGRVIGIGICDELTGGERLISCCLDSAQAVEGMANVLQEQNEVHGIRW